MSVVLVGGIAALAVVSGCGSDAGAESVASPLPAASSPAAASAPAASSTSAAEAPLASAADGSAANAPAAAGSYVTYADYEADPAAFAGTDVVLFFNASWCPTCQTTVANLTSEPVPAGLTVVSVDFDDSTDLRSQYGVTTQHTFVQIDPQGVQLAKWTGSTDAAAISDQLAS
ncbi:MAG: hypothetical protein QG597_501 [Actinomycetota bacterium]|nr:hypothetical protein [Actinomycetota bacterium]